MYKIIDKTTNKVLGLTDDPQYAIVTAQGEMFPCGKEVANIITFSASRKAMGA